MKIYALVFNDDWCGDLQFLVLSTNRKDCEEWLQEAYEAGGIEEDYKLLEIEIKEGIFWNKFDYEYGKGSN